MRSLLNEFLWTCLEINQSRSFRQNFVYLFCDGKQTAALVIILLVRPKYSEPQTAKNAQMRLHYKSYQRWR